MHHALSPMEFLWPAVLGDRHDGRLASTSPRLHAPARRFVAAFPATYPAFLFINSLQRAQRFGVTPRTAQRDRAGRAPVAALAGRAPAAAHHAQPFPSE
jgi:hypothetical protein